MKLFFDWLLHLDTHLSAFAAGHGAWTYALLFAVIFVETGIVVLPFLPGDSLLFVSGALAANGAFDAIVLFAVFFAAAVVGDTANFAIGHWVHERANGLHHIRFLRQKHLDETKAFFERHGKKTIVLARFVPVVRTLAPFVAAFGQMNYRSFLAYNVIGGAAWVGALLTAGYVLGTQPFIRDHLTAVLLGIVAISVLPGVVGWLKERGQQ
jgi:membrane-associated protein